MIYVEALMAPADSDVSVEDGPDIARRTPAPTKRTTPKGTVSAAARPDGLPRLSRPATKDFLTSKPRPWQIVEIHGNVSAVRALAAAERALAVAEEEAEKERRRNRQANGSGPESAAADRLRACQREVDRCREAVEESTREILLAGIGRDEKEAILEREDCQPSESDMAEAEKANMKAAFNTKTYPTALIAASLVDPEMSEGEVEAMICKWNDAEFLVLWQATLAVNSDSSLVSLGKGSNGMVGSRRN